MMMITKTHFRLISILDKELEQAIEPEARALNLTAIEYMNHRMELMEQAIQDGYPVQYAPAPMFGTA